MVGNELTVACCKTLTSSRVTLHPNLHSKSTTQSSDKIIYYLQGTLIVYDRLEIMVLYSHQQGKTIFSLLALFLL